MSDNYPLNVKNNLSQSGYSQVPIVKGVPDGYGGFDVITNSSPNVTSRFFAFPGFLNLVSNGTFNFGTLVAGSTQVTNSKIALDPKLMRKMIYCAHPLPPLTGVTGTVSLAVETYIELYRSGQPLTRLVYRNEVTSVNGASQLAGLPYSNIALAPLIAPFSDFANSSVNWSLASDMELSTQAEGNAVRYKSNGFSNANAAVVLNSKIVTLYPVNVICAADELRITGNTGYAVGVSAAPGANLLSNVWTDGVFGVRESLL